MDLSACLASQDSANLLMAALSELGITAEHVPSISRGLELVDSQRFDAIVLDYSADRVPRNSWRACVSPRKTTPAR